MRPNLIRVYLAYPVNQDATTLQILVSDADGNQWYARDIVWQSYKGFDMLDTTNLTWPGWVRFETQQPRRP